jgi:hypothetical protein
MIRQRALAVSQFVVGQKRDAMRRRGENDVAAKVGSKRECFRPSIPCAHSVMDPLAQFRARYKKPERVLPFSSQPTPPSSFNNPRSPVQPAFFSPHLVLPRHYLTSTYSHLLLSPTPFSKMSVPIFFLLPISPLFPSDPLERPDADSSTRSCRSCSCDNASKNSVGTGLLVKGQFFSSSFHFPSIILPIRSDSIDLLCLVPLSRCRVPPVLVLLCRRRLLAREGGSLDLLHQVGSGPCHP